MNDARVHPTATGPTAERAGRLVRRTGAVVGLSFLLVGALGFVPGVTESAEELPMHGPHSDARLLGIFSVSVWHNVAHLLFGVVGLSLARTVLEATRYLLLGGIAYLALALVGVVVAEDSDLNVLALNRADDWLHLGLGLGMVGLGLLGTRALPGRTGAGAPR